MLIEKNKVGRFILPDFKTYYEAGIIKQYGTGIKTEYRPIELNRKP